MDGSPSDRLGAGLAHPSPWLALVVVLGITGATWLTYGAGGTATPMPHLYYLPILLGAFLFGASGGLTTALVAGLLCGPYMPLNVAEAIPQTGASWLLRTGLFASVGLFAGALTTSLRAQLHDLEGLHASVRDERRRLRDVLEAMTLPIITFVGDPPTTEFANASARELFGGLAGTPVEEFLRLGDWRTMAGDPIQPTAAMRAFELARERPVDARVRLRLADGSERVIQSVLVEAGDGSTLLVLRDVTDEAAFEVTRRRFVDLAAHHLRTPLTPAVGFAELIASRIGRGGDQAVLVEASVAMRRATLRLSHLLDRLQELATLQPALPERFRIERMGHLVLRAWTSVGGSAGHLRLSGATSAVASCVRDHAVRALVEVLNNALVHGRPPVHVVITESAAGVEARVRDSGAGIDAEWAEAIFAPYMTDREGEAPPPTGAGLGLAVARARVEATRGSLRYDAVDHTFVLRLPAAAVGVLASRASNGAPRARRRVAS